MSETNTISSTEFENKNVYNRVFWLCYIANVALVAANALTFRFAELVNYLGGTESFTGTVVSTGVIAALLVRLRLGQDIDSRGTRRLWTSSALLFVMGCAMFLLTRHLSWQIYAARIAFAVGLAGMFTCSIVYIQNQVPAHRRTEVIGNLGSSGFVGMVTGALLGDLIFNTVPNGPSRFTILFGGATLLGTFYLTVVLYLTRRDIHRRPPQTPPLHQLIFRHWPGAVVLVAVMMGMSLAVTTVFLTRFTTERGLSGIGPFFFGYAVSAFIFRISTRKWSRTVGRHRMILMGLTGHCLGHWILPFVWNEWFLLVAAVSCGFGHALLFPAVVSLGAETFPTEYRGTGTNVILGFTDVGQIIFAPILGAVIDYLNFPWMFFTSGSLALTVAGIYAFTAARKPDRELISSSGKDKEEDEEAHPAMGDTVPSPQTPPQPSPEPASSSTVASVSRKA